MSLSKGVEIHSLSSVKAGMIRFYTPQASHETMLVQIPANTIDDMFVHKYQTDQLMVVRGSLVLVILHNAKYQYIPLNFYEPKVVTIPPLVPHSAINFSGEPCMLINAVMRHGQPHPSDYRPLKAPFPHDFDRVDLLLSGQECSVAA
jgi:mannose-6-phosphate isomerase-like protein (cupin superfamily)